MIICRQIVSYKHEIFCDNCQRNMPLVLTYDLLSKDVLVTHKTVWLCEDCSAAIGRLHMAVMEQGKTHKYDMDEIKEVVE